MDLDHPFTFPHHTPREVATALLTEAYQEIDAGKVLRRALKEQRRQGWDPPHDAQYVCEPAVAEYPEGLGVSLGSDILLHEPFPGQDECLAIFEGILGDLLMERLERKVVRWLKTKTPPAGPY